MIRKKVLNLSGWWTSLTWNMKTILFMVKSSALNETHQVALKTNIAMVSIDTGIGLF